MDSSKGRAFLQGFSRYDSTPENIIIVFAIAMGFSVYLYTAYRILTRKGSWSKSFNLALPALTLVCTAIMLAVQAGRGGAALGVLGPLFIIRFRTSVKEPSDMLFLFWAVAAGIICGAGMAEVAAALSFVLTTALLVLDRIPLGRAPKILIVTMDGGAEEQVLAVVRSRCRRFAVKSRPAPGRGGSLSIAVWTAKDAELVREVAGLGSVSASTLLVHDGEAAY